jgi:uncharacterized protein (UPF0333 family)
VEIIAKIKKEGKMKKFLSLGFKFFFTLILLSIVLTASYFFSKKATKFSAVIVYEFIERNK